MNKDVIKAIKHKMIDEDLTMLGLARKYNLSYSQLNAAMNKRKGFGFKAQTQLCKFIPELTEKDFEEHNNSLKLV